MKQKKKNAKSMLIINGVMVFVFLFVNVFSTIILSKQEKAIIEKSYNAIENADILKEYSEDSIDDSQVTIRKDIMYVTKRNLQRPSVKIMSDTYSLPGSDVSVTFPSYPGYRNYHDIREDYEKAGGVNYLKYMLLRQGMLTIQDCVNKSKDGSLTQDDLYKHPAIDDQYGAVKSGDNAVEKVIIIDPSYRSFHTTGLYLPAGELVHVKVEELSEKESISIETYINTSLGYASGLPSTYFEDTDRLVNEQRFDEIVVSSQYSKLNTLLPYMSASFKFDENKEYNIGTPFGGMMHLNVANTKSPVKITITGAVEHPHFILGVTSEEYFETYLKDSPGVSSALDTENGILVGDDLPFRDISDISNIALLWHSFFSVNENFTGGPYDANNLVIFDVNVPAGGAVHLGGGVSVCPISWYKGALDYQSLLENGSWGVLHEIGHGNGNAYGTVWGLNGTQDGEVRNNALTVLIYLKFLDLGTSRKGEHSEFGHAYLTLKNYINASNGKSDYNDYGFFEALSGYVNLMHSFGVDKFYELLKTYKDNKAYYQNKRADFIYRCSLVYKMDFRWYFNEMYKANVSNHEFSNEHLSYMESLDEYVPIASNYEGGIDGIKTSGNIKLSAYAPTVLNFNANTISPKEFTIDKINDPKYGEIVKNEDDTYTYIPPKEFVLNDEFSYEVSQFNGVKHTFQVYITFNYHSSEVNTYRNTQTTNLDVAMSKIEEIQPEVSYDSTPGITQYNDGILLKTAEFIYKAKENKEHTFYFRSDDSSILMMSYNGKDYEQKVKINGDKSPYIKENSFKVTLAKDQLIYFKIYNVNFGGTGYATVGLENDNGSVSHLDINQIYAPYLNENQINEIENVKREQNYYVSLKENITSSYDVNKDEWEVIAAPNHQNGNTYQEEVVDENGNTITVTKSKTDFLLDGDNSTIYHSIWNHSGRSEMPHEYTIDTKKVQSFNFYQLATRNRQDSLIKKYELYISDDGVNYKLIHSGEEMKYDNYIATLRFDLVKGRFLKLLVYTTSGKNTEYFSIISEIYAGIISGEERIVSVSNSNINTSSDFKINQDNENEIANGILFTKNQGSTINFSFKGKEFSLYSTKGKEFGKAKIYIDGIEQEEIDLNSDKYQFKKLVYHIEGLEDEIHDVEVVTLDNNLFNLEYIGISNDANIEEKIITSRNNLTHFILSIVVIVLWFAFVIYLAFVISLFVKNKNLFVVKK